MWRRMWPIVLFMECLSTNPRALVLIFFYDFFPLQANLPLLQRELLHCARAAKQTPAQYLSQHEHLLLSTAAPSPADSTELLLEPSDNSKRHSPNRYPHNAHWAKQLYLFNHIMTHPLIFLINDRSKENGFHERPSAQLEPPAKRICTISPAPRHSPAHPMPLQIHPTPPPLQHYALDDISTPHLYREPHRILELRELKDRPRLPGYYCTHTCTHTHKKSVSSSCKHHINEIQIITPINVGGC